MVLENPEKRELLPASAKTITGNELMERIYQGQSLPQDSRFLPYDEGGVFKYFYLSELTGINGPGNKFYSTIETDGKIVGLAELCLSQYNPKNLEIRFASVDPEFQNQGHASSLAEEIFRFASAGGYTLETSAYSTEGFVKLKPKFNELAKKYKVQFKDTEEKWGI